jgi:serine/threonine protein phosphatase PrpC
MEDRCYVSAYESRGRVRPSSGEETAVAAAPSKSLQPLAIGCVFDGHNGDYVAEMLKQRFAVSE